jgi:nicotinamide phosphoribosyltransferase
MKWSAALVDGKWVDVYKDPIHDKGKQSKKGRVTLFKTENGFVSGIENGEPEALETVFANGVLIRDMTFDEIRANAAI